MGKKFICDILNSNYNIYTLRFPDGHEGEYHKNTGRNLFVGKKSLGFGVVDVYYFSIKSLLQIELEEVEYSIDLNNYTSITLKDCKEKTEYLHKIVAFSWGKRIRSDYYLEVDHIDRNKFNNTPENLQYMAPLVNAYKEVLNNNPNGKNYFKEKVEKMKDNEELKFNIEEIIKYWLNNIK